MSDSSHWIDFWKKQGRATQDADEQTQVLRTSNKIPIESPLWEFTLRGIEKNVQVGPGDTLLELCCGNGLISRHFAAVCSHVTAVDVSSDLLAPLKESVHQNIRAIASDVRDIEFEAESFSRVIIYAGIQYFTLSETIVLFEKIYRWLIPGGIFFLGDVPDSRKRWAFYDSVERESVYFDNAKENKDIIGTWFDPELLEKLATYAGFGGSEFFEQHKDLIYSHFRFDYRFTK